MKLYLLSFMYAVILAAGRGTRMPEITHDKPKCLIEINGKKLLCRQLEILFKNNIEKVFIVIGYKSEEIINEVASNPRLELIENKDFAITDNIYSLYLVSNKLIGNEFLLLNGDTIFDEKIITDLIDHGDGNIAPVDTSYYDLEELKIREKNRKVTEILPKNAKKDISGGSTIGIFKFSTQGGRIFLDEIKKIVENGEKNKWFEYALNKALKKIDMDILDIQGNKWLEIDTTDDIKKANIIFGE